MFKKHKDTADIEEFSSATSEEPQSKSFMVGGGSRIVALTLPGIHLSTQMFPFSKNKLIRSNPIV